MKKILVLLSILSVFCISCVERYDTHWIPVKTYKCYVNWNDNHFSLQCRTKQGDIFNVEMRHHHYYQAEMKRYLYVNAPCEIYVFKDTLTNNYYYRLYKSDDYEAHVSAIEKIR